ncbi:DUF6443 domain-containing protein [Pedobacter sp. SYSU D00535]|uniref:DUF6443 domain-containing protein n=1 Tax=Pedobacter sp. SYSU D00535 TaxID=2810308 RepID=UPI001A95DC44|nr:DUF6443 domain-containing protein [Pedobacter sp. SYSU D00535]
MVRILQKTFILIFLLSLLKTEKSKAGEEPYESFLRGTLSKGAVVSIQDEKFNNPSFNKELITDMSVDNFISLRILDDTPINQSFSCTVSLRVEYFSDPSQTDPTVIDPVNLTVKYTNDGTAVLQDLYKFNSGYLVNVHITNISSPELGETLPPVLQISNKIIVNRIYKFTPDLGLGLIGTLNSNNSVNTSFGSLSLSWPAVIGAQEYDLEWVAVDEGSEFEATVNSMAAGTEVAGMADKLFRNNATRITTDDNAYKLALVFNSKYIVSRIRQVAYNAQGVRVEGDWQYKQNNASRSYAVWNIENLWHEKNLNWQYSVAYAEEGKKKEVISYFDGTLRGRQTATINSSDNVAVVQENIYDEFGRAVANILPAPVKENATGSENLHFFRNFNRNLNNQPYTFADIAQLCELKPSALSTSSGASKYYSDKNQFIAENGFKSNRNFDKYIPHAEGYPFSITQYTADNTGRIKIQGGVGQTFQPGLADLSKTTKYFYGTPTQGELDRLFGNDVGYANHYLKNMVIDPNGQISISYLNASGKTIATALTGNAPDGMDALPSSENAAKTQRISLLTHPQFRFDASALSLSASTTHLVSAPGKVLIEYDIERLIACYTEGTFKLCKDCFYDLSIRITDDCGEEVFNNSSAPVKIGYAGVAEVKSIEPDFKKIGEYNVTFNFVLSKQGMETYADNFIREGQVDGQVKKELVFVKKYLDELGLGTFGGCERCKEALGTQEDFTEMFKEKLLELQLATTDISALEDWISGKYQVLSQQCQALQASCVAPSPCEKYIGPMLEDVSPGGQYAMFDTNNKVLEPELNVLKNYWATEFSLPAGSTAPEADLVTLDDGSVISPYDEAFVLETVNGQKVFTAKNLLVHWKPEWAHRFLKYHPEQCKLEFCEANKQYVAWDNLVSEKITHSETSSIPGAVGTYNHNSPSWLLDIDPFFNTGPGAIYKLAIQKDLTQYTSEVLGASVATKNVQQFIDYFLYCGDAKGRTNNNRIAGTNNIDWEACNPVADCRVPNREWQQYQEMYLELKEDYYKKYRDEVYCPYKQCLIGIPAALPIPGEISARDFYIMKSTSVSACSGMEQRIDVLLMNGKTLKPTKVLVYIPGQTGVAELDFNIGETVKSVCVPFNIPASAMKVSDVLVLEEP